MNIVYLVLDHTGFPRVAYTTKAAAEAHVETKGERDWKVWSIRVIDDR